MKMKKLLLVFLALSIAMTSVVFTGCGDKEDTPAGDEATPTPTRDENTVFVWWSQDANDLTLLNDAWFDFRDLYALGENAKYSDKINMFSMSGNADGTTQLEQQYMAGTAPDVVRMDHVYITALGQKGVFLDLQKEFQATDNLSDQFIASTWEASSSFGAVYGIPFDANTIIFGARSDILDQAGVSIPETYDDLRSAGAKIKALNLDQMAYTLPCGTDGRYNWPAFVFMFWVWRLGGDVLNEDMTEAIFNDTETGVEALNMMMQLQEDGLISKTEYQEHPNSVAMCDYGTWWLNGFEYDMEFTLQPQLKEGVERYSGLGLYDLAVVTTAKNPQLSYDFIVHFATGKNSTTDKHYLYTYCKNHSWIPSLTAAAETDETWNAENTESEFWRVSVEQLELSKYRPPVPCWPEIEEALSTAVTQAMTGEKAPKEALDAAAATANRLLTQWHESRNAG